MNVKVMVTMFVILSVIGVLGGCIGTKVNNKVAFDYTTFKTMQEKWNSANKSDYTFNYVETGSETNYDLKVKVTNGIRESISLNSEASGMRFDEELTVSKIITDIETLYQENNEKTFEREKDTYITKIDVKYNNQTGYPEEVTYEYNKPAEGMKDIQKKIAVKMDI